MKNTLTDLNNYLESISYDEKQICDERNKVIQKILRDETIFKPTRKNITGGHKKRG